MKHSQHTNAEHLAKNQYNSSLNLKKRWDLYQFTEPKFDIYKEIIKNIKLKGSEAVLDIGCGDGSFLIDLQKTTKHYGKLTGIDISPGMIREAKLKTKQNSKYPHISFKVGNLHSISLPDDSIDAIYVLFTLYHAPDKTKAIRELYRVLKKNGLLIIATAGKKQKYKLDAFKKLYKSITGKNPPPKIASTFNLENGKEQLSNLFKVIDIKVYNGIFKLTQANPYIESFDGGRDMYVPKPTNQEWNTVKLAVRKKIDKEIKSKGYFTDNYCRGYILCKKT